jgi:predicted porin
MIRKRRNSMRAQLIAVVIAGLVLAAPAGAQTAGVTLYGRLNLDMEVVNGKQGGAGCPSDCPNPNQYRVSSNASMVGLRGTEPLDGGLNAIFQVESKLFADTGGGVLAGRETYVGLRGAFGTARIGHFLSPYDEIQPIFGSAPTLTTSILSTGALWAQAYLGPPLAGGFDDRLSNSVRYDTPTLSGFNASLQYSTAEGSPTPSSGIVSFGGFYDNGPLQLGLAYEIHHNIRGTREAPLSDTALSIAGGYQFEGIRLGAVYERLRYDATPSTDITRDFYGLGVTIDAGPGLVFLYVGHAGNGKGSAADGSNVGGLVKGESTGSTQWEASYTYVLSARTWLYGGYVKINNQSNAGYTFDSNLYPVFCNTYPNGGCGKPGGFVAGAVHFF